MRARNKRTNGPAMAVTSVNGKGGHGYENEQGSLGERAWGEEREGGNDMIMSSSQK